MRSLVRILMFSELRGWTDRTIIEKGKQEAILGNAAGVYLVYMGLRSALPEVEAVKRGEATVSDERLARQLEAE